MHEPMRISPLYNVADWKQLQLPEDGAWEGHEATWRKALDIFEDRYRGRFLTVINVIEGYEFAGFAVLALDCLLIETLEQFRQGKKETPHRQSGQYFVNFPTNTSFNEFFDAESAQEFYDQIRSGILHQAEVKTSSRILIRQGTPLVSYTDDKKGLIINRRLFHQRLELVFHEYLSELQSPENTKLRQKFKKKMDHICRL